MGWLCHIMGLKHLEHEVLYLLREIQEDLRKQHREIMIAQATLDASLAGLTTAVDAAVAALASGSVATSTPDTVVTAYQTAVDAQTLRLATATPPPTQTAPAVKAFKE